MKEAIPNQAVSRDVRRSENSYLQTPVNRTQEGKNDGAVGCLVELELLQDGKGSLDIST